MVYALICIIIALLTGCVGYLIGGRKQQALKAEAEFQMKKAEELKEQIQTEKSEAEHRLQEAKEEAAKQTAQLSASYQQQLDQQSKLIKEQINSASEEILKKRAEELKENNVQQLQTILNPLHENLKQMREAVERADREHTNSMERLDASIKENLKQAKQVGERADKLAEALTNENKVQGNFGELRLRTLLENMGLQEGLQFEEQSMLKDNGTAITSESGRRMIPDVILHFPDHRDVIIDSKMSLKAFEDYHNAQTAEEREDALKRHILSVRNHVKELSNKKYYDYTPKGQAHLDFVMMYIYSESALQLALANDPTLWKDAYDQNVIISGSQNLYMMLRVLEMTWRQVRQAENQDLIMSAANELINRVQMFYERFEDASSKLDSTQAAFKSLKIITAPTGASIATSANKLLKYGAQENPKRKKHIPQSNDEDKPQIEDQQTLPKDSSN